jgi:hypothetical protein
MRPTWLLLSCSFAACVLAGCRTPVPATSGPAQRVPTLTLHGQEVLRLELEQPVRAPDMGGIQRTYTSAWLVRLQVDRPGFADETVYFYIGEFQVPEYGGWEKGIYFKVYDPAFLTSLRGKQLRYRIGHTEVQSFDRTLEIPDLEKVPVRQERELFPARVRPR